jgi:chromatin remodeling complex protein RSC6
MAESTDNVVIETEQSSPIDTQFDSILYTLTQLKGQITIISSQIKMLEKTVKKEIKTHKKEADKKKPKGTRKPSGFAAASPISDQLATFLGKPSGTEMPRTEVTKHICDYIKQNSLQSQENSRIINPNTELKTLLDVNDTDEITYFNIQRYMNKHFLKKDKKTVSKEK